MDLTESLDEFASKAAKALKYVDKFITGNEKQLVLEVGSHTTKIVEYIIKSKKIEVTGGAVVATPANAIENDRILDNKVFVNVLAQALRTENIKTREFVASIASKEIIIREMNVPHMREKELKSFVQINSNDIFPVKLSNYILAYNIIEKGKTNRVMIAAIPKDIVESYLELGEKLGLSLKSINYSGYELYNFLDYELDSVNEPYLAMDVGAQNTNIVIISNGALKFNKIVPKGLDEASVYISQVGNCSLERAEQLKKQYNTVQFSEESPANSPETVIAKCTAKSINNILQEVYRIMGFFNSNNAKNKVSKIYIVGTAAKIKGIEEYISQKLNVEVIALKQLNKIDYNKYALKLKARQQILINCFGANQLKDRVLHVISNNIKFKKIAVILKAKFLKIAFCFALIMVALILYQYNSLDVVNQNINKYSSYYNSKKEVVSLNDQNNNLQKEIDNKKSYIEKIGYGVEKHNDLIKLVENVIYAMPTDAQISVSRYTFNNKSLQFQCKINVPLEAEENFYNVNYINLPYDLENLVEKELEKYNEKNSLYKDGIDDKVSIKNNKNEAFTLEVTI